MTANPAPGFKRRPDYRIVTRPAGVRVRVRFDGEVIADSRDALVMKEGDYPPVYSFPPTDVRMERLVRSAHHPHCPFKGTASYFGLFSGILQQLYDLAPHLAAAAYQKGAVPAELFRARAHLHEFLTALGNADENENATGLKAHIRLGRR